MSAENNSVVLNSTEPLPASLNNPSWLTNIDNEFQAFVGFGACIAQGVLGMAQTFGQSEVMCAKIDAEASLAKIKVENDGRVQAAKLEKESQVIASTMTVFKEEVARLGSRIDRMSAVLLEKYSATDLTPVQIKEREELQTMIARDQQQLDELLRHIMLQAKS